MASNTDLRCDVSPRRADIRAREQNGIDYVEVSDDGLVLTVTFLAKAPPLVKEMVQILGGSRIRNILPVDLRVGSEDDEELEDAVRIFLNKGGDLSTYTLGIFELDDLGQPTRQPLRELDARYNKVDFTFHAGKASSLDCVPSEPAQALAETGPRINYLAKDFASFRQLMLDRLALTLPEWTERHVPDVGIALVEVLAYVADYLSYYQDAVATEAYLSTARQRISVRRHVKLLDYTMHEGCNARTWIAITASEDQAEPGLDPASIDFVADSSPAESQAVSRISAGSSRADTIDVFQPVLTHEIKLYRSHNLIPFYTWGDAECHLPMGATHATLVDQWKSGDRTGDSPPDYEGGESTPQRELQLRAGDFLLLQEMRGPRTGSANDADPSHRQIVCLTSVEQNVDELYDQPVVEVYWGAADALQFPLLISNTGAAPDCARVDGISAASGNVILADQGFWAGPEDLGVVPRRSANQRCMGANQPADLEIVAERFRPTLKRSPLVFRQRYVKATAAAKALIQDPRLAAPQISLRSIAPLPDGSGPVFQPSEFSDLSSLVTRLHIGTDDATSYLRNQLSSRTISMLTEQGSTSDLAPAFLHALTSEMERFVTTWQVVPDLMNSLSQDAHFAVEVDDSSVAHLRFGDGTIGRAPEAGSGFFATYRVAGQDLGEFGAGVINRIVTRGLDQAGIVLTAQNPVSAQGGVLPEDVAKVKLLAPGAYRSDLERAVTAADYATIAQRHEGVQRAAATLEWTGTRYEVHVAVDPLGTDLVAPSLLQSVDVLLQRYRRIGHDLTVAAAEYVSLDLALQVEIAPDYLNAHVRSALLSIFSNGLDETGSPALFHPDNLTFGTSIYASQLISAALSVEGVVSAAITRLRRLFAQPSHEPMVEDVLSIGPLEIARLDRDPAHPENGVLRLDVRGGR